MTNIEGLGAIAPPTAEAQATQQATNAEAPISDKETLKTENNAAILNASLEVSISSGNDSMALLFKAAIENINEALAPEMGPQAIEAAYESGLDISAEATADRIVSLTTAMFPSYLESHPELSIQEAATQFSELIGGGITQGFGEARDILDGLGVLTEEISTLIDDTYDQVQVKLQEFVDQQTQTDATTETVVEDSQVDVGLE